jgi:hypothetical protein
MSGLQKLNSGQNWEVRSGDLDDFIPPTRKGFPVRCSGVSGSLG